VVTILLHSQVNGHGGIPRFNRNLNEASENKVVLSLNDNTSYGSDKNKFRFLAQTVKALFKKKPKFVIIGHLNFTPLALLIFMITKAKVVVILHGVEAWQKRNKLKLFYHFVDEFWSVSDYTSQQFHVSNGVNLNKIKPIFNTLPSNWDLKPTSLYKPYMLTVTRLDKSEGYKGVEESLHAISKLKDEMALNNFKYKLVVHGDDVQRHKNLCKELEISDFVDFETNLTDSELMELYENCSFFSLPSTGEGFGIVFLEAMACRKACVGCVRTGAEDVIVNKSTGFLIEQNTMELVRVYRELIKSNQYCKELGLNGQQRLKDNFTFDKFSNRISKLINMDVK